MEASTDDIKKFIEVYCRFSPELQIPGPCLYHLFTTKTGKTMQSKKFLNTVVRLSPGVKKEPGQKTTTRRRHDASIINGRCTHLSGIDFKPEFTHQIQMPPTNTPSSQNDPSPGRPKEERRLRMVQVRLERKAVKRLQDGNSMMKEILRKKKYLIERMNSDIQAAIYLYNVSDNPEKCYPDIPCLEIPESTTLEQLIEIYKWSNGTLQYNVAKFMAVTDSKAQRRGHLCPRDRDCFEFSNQYSLELSIYSKSLKRCHRIIDEAYINYPHLVNPDLYPYLCELKIVRLIIM